MRMYTGGRLPQNTIALIKKRRSLFLTGRVAEFGERSLLKLLSRGAFIIFIIFIISRLSSCDLGTQGSRLARVATAVDLNLLGRRTSYQTRTLPRGIKTSSPDFKSRQSPRLMINYYG